MFDELVKILKKELRIKGDIEITPDSRIREDLGADSLDVLQMLMTIEEDYNITIPNEELATFKTVGDIVEYLNKIK